MKKLENRGNDERVTGKEEDSNKEKDKDFFLMHCISKGSHITRPPRYHHSRKNS
jgi:hypothetical protein